MALDFTLTPEQEAMKESCRKFAEKEISPGAMERDVKGEFEVERGLRDSLLGTIGGGTSEIQRMIIGRTLLGL